MRRKQAKPLGLGHPLVDALLAELQGGDRFGTVTNLDGGGSAERSVRVHCLAHVAYEDGHVRRFLRAADLHPDGSWTPVQEEQETSLLTLLQSRAGTMPAPKATDLLPDWTTIFSAAISVWEAELRAQESGVLSVRFVTTGIAYGVSKDIKVLQRTPSRTAHTQSPVPS